MKNVHYLKALSFTFLLLLFANCGGDGDSDPNTNPNPNPDPDPTPSRTINDVMDDFNSLTFVTGVNDFDLESTLEGFFWNVRIIMPEGASDVNKRPLIFSLHGAATAVSGSIHKSTSCLVEPGFDALDAIIISPNSKGYLWSEETSVFQIFTLMDLAKEFLPIDQSKIAVMGYSDGGNGAWYFAEFYPNLFSASIPMSSSYNTAKTGTPVKFNIPIYAIHGSDDQLFPISTTEGYVNQSITAGSDITFVRANGLEHNNTCDYVSYLQDAATWLDTVAWN